jgi:hypothetical protein
MRRRSIAGTSVGGLEAELLERLWAARGPLSALAKVGLAQAERSAVPGASGFADPEDLRYRIRRLQRPRPRRARTALALGLVGAGLAGALAEASCLLLHAGSGWTAVLPCLATFGYLGWRPAWARPGRPGRGAARSAG